MHGGRIYNTKRCYWAITVSYNYDVIPCTRSNTKGARVAPSVLEEHAKRTRVRQNASRRFELPKAARRAKVSRPEEAKDQ